MLLGNEGNSTGVARQQTVLLRSEGFGNSSFSKHQNKINFLPKEKTSDDFFFFFAPGLFVEAVKTQTEA